MPWKKEGIATILFLSSSEIPSRELKCPEKKKGLRQGKLKLYLYFLKCWNALKKRRDCDLPAGFEFDFLFQLLLKCPEKKKGLRPYWFMPRRSNSTKSWNALKKRRDCDGKIKWGALRGSPSWNALNKRRDCDPQGDPSCGAPRRGGWNALNKRRDCDKQRRPTFRAPHKLFVEMPWIKEGIAT